MFRIREVTIVLLAVCCSSFLTSRPAQADGIGPSSVPERVPAQEPQRSSTPGKLTVTVGKSLIIDSPIEIKRLSVANGDLIEAVAVNPKEVLINGKAPGETSLIIWQQNGNRLLYDLTVRMSPLKLDAVRQQLARDFPDSEINVTYENDTAFVRGTVKDLISADRVMSICATLGKTINLLSVDVPPADTQILLKVKFANVDRSATLNLGANFTSGAFNQSTGVSTQQFSPSQIDNSGAMTLSQALNVLLFRKDINVGVTIAALQAKNLLEMLAEPNLLAVNGKPASFLQGGEFPIPMVQGSSALGQVSIEFRQFGIRLQFLPVITPRGTIRLQVAPEVSSLDYSHAVVISGFTIPALSTRRVQTEVELDSGQSFVIAGLMDNSLTDTISKIPGLGDIPLLGKLFQSKAVQKNNSELLVIVTPEIVRPMPVGMPLPELSRELPFLPTKTPPSALRQPGLDKTGAEPAKPKTETVPIEMLQPQQRPGQAAPAPNTPSFELLPIPATGKPSINPGLTAPALPPNGGTGSSTGSGTGASGAGGGDGK